MIGCGADALLLIWLVSIMAVDNEQSLLSKIENTRIRNSNLKSRISNSYAYHQLQCEWYSCCHEQGVHGLVENRPGRCHLHPGNKSSKGPGESPGICKTGLL